MESLDNNEKVKYLVEQINKELDSLDEIRNDHFKKLSYIRSFCQHKYFCEKNLHNGIIWTCLNCKHFYVEYKKLVYEGNSTTTGIFPIDLTKSEDMTFYQPTGIVGEFYKIQTQATISGNVSDTQSLKVEIITTPLYKNYPPVTPFDFPGSDYDEDYDGMDY